MTPLAIAIIVLVCVFCAGLLGLFLGRVLAENHLSGASQDLVKLVTGLIATLSALVLGLLIASAKASFDAVNEEFRDAGAKTILLDRALAQYGPETRDLRGLLRAGFASRVERLFSKDRSAFAAMTSTEATDSMEDFQQGLRTLSPQNDEQRAIQSRALQLADALVQARWLAIEHAENTIPTPFLVVLVFWLSAMFVGFGLFAPPNGTVVVALFVGALSLSTSILLIEEMNHPIGGFITIPRAPLDTAYRQLGH